MLGACSERSCELELIAVIVKILRFIEMGKI